MTVDVTLHAHGRVTAHAVRRAWQRFGIALSHRDCQAVLTDIREGRAPPIPGYQRFKATAHAVEVRGRPMIAIVADDCVVTFLPLSMWTRRRNARRTFAEVIAEARR